MESSGISHVPKLHEIVSVAGNVVTVVTKHVLPCAAAEVLVTKLARGIAPFSHASGRFCGSVAVTAACCLGKMDVCTGWHRGKFLKPTASAAPRCISARDSVSRWTSCSRYAAKASSAHNFRKNNRNSFFTDIFEEGIELKLSSPPEHSPGIVDICLDHVGFVADRRSIVPQRAPAIGTPPYERTTIQIQ